MREKESLELSIIMPCQDEENTVGICVDEAVTFMKKRHINGEVVVVDSDSADDSASIAKKHGARVVTEVMKGYGNAIQTGISNSRGRILIIGDCDTTYDFLHLDAMYDLLYEERCDMVIGNRYTGGMEHGSMPWLHKWGVRFLSFCGRKRFHSQVYDFHCGLRGISRKTAGQLVFYTKGMEFATEMIAEAEKNHFRIMQVPVVLQKCNYKRKSKLRTVRDGLRHLGYILRGTGRL